MYEIGPVEAKQVKAVLEYMTDKLDQDMCSSGFGKYDPEHLGMLVSGVNTLADRYGFGTEYYKFPWRR